MKLKDMIGSMASKFAALVLTFGLAGGAWCATEAISLQYTNMTLNVGTSCTALIAKISPYNGNRSWRVPSAVIDNVSFSGNSAAITVGKSISGSGSYARVAITVTANAVTEGFETITISYDGASAQLRVKVNATPSSECEAYVVQALSTSSQMFTDWCIKQGSEDTLANLLASSESVVEVNNYTGDITIPAGKAVTLSSTSRAQIGTITNNGTLKLGTITAQTIVNNSSLNGKNDYNNPPIITANITNNAQGTIGETSTAPFILEGNIVNYGTVKLPTYGKETTISGIIYQYNTDTTLEIPDLTTDNIGSKVGGVVLADGASVKAVGRYFYKNAATLEESAAINLAAKEAIGVSAASPNYNVVATGFSNSSTSTSYAIFTAQLDPNAPAYVVNVAGLGGFETFKAAWDAMMSHNSGSSITLLDDVTVDDVLVDTLSSGSWYLQLNGHTLTVNGGFSFANDWWIDSSSTAGTGTIVINGDNLAERFSIGDGEHAKLTIVKGYVNAELSSETSLLEVFKLVYANGYTITQDSTNIYVQRASNVPAVVPVTGISLDKTEMTLAVGETNTLTATITPANATTNDIQWSAGDNYIASIDYPFDSPDRATIKVIGQSAGTAYFHARPLDWGTANPQDYVCCTVTVTRSSNFFKDANDDNLWHVANLAGLQEFRNEVNAGNSFAGKTVVLDVDIDMSSIASWDPIGQDYKTIQNTTLERRFAGTFDGNGKTISNLTIDRPNADYVGLIGITSGAASGVKDLTIANADIKGRGFVGSVIGSVGAGSTISDVVVSGLVKVSGNWKVGGAFGAGNARYERCSVIGETGSQVIGAYLGPKSQFENAIDDYEGDNVGGLIGHIEAGSTGGTSNGIYGCAASGLTVKGTRKVGGIVGACALYTWVQNVTASDIVLGTNATLEYANGKKSTMGLGGIIGSYFETVKTSATLSGTVQNITVLVNEFENGISFAAGNVNYGLVVGSYRDLAKPDPAEHAAFDLSGITAIGYDAAKYSNDYLIPKVAQVGDVKYVTFADAIAAADEAGVDEITILNGVTESPDAGWKIADGKLVRKVYVAQIGETKYYTLAEAVEAVPENGAEATTIKMLANEELSATVAIPATKNIVLDLNGKTVSGSATVLNVAGTLVIDGSTSGSGISSTGDETVVVNGGTLTVAGGSYMTTGNNKYVFRVKNSATVTIDGCTTVCAEGSNLKGFLRADGGSEVVINDATVNIGCQYYVLDSRGGSTITVKDGSFVKHDGRQYQQFADMKQGNIAIEGGSFTFNYTGAGIGGTAPEFFVLNDADSDDGYTEDGKSVLTISGGTFTGLWNNASLEKVDAVIEKAIAYKNTAQACEVYVSGGTYNYNPANWVGWETGVGTNTSYPFNAEGYDVVDNDNGTWTVVSLFEAQIVRDGAVVTPKGTLAEMVAAAQSGDTVKLLDHVYLTQMYTVPNGKNITLDLAGYSISPVIGEWYGGDMLLCVAYGATLTIDDSSEDKSGRIDTSLSEDVLGAIKMTNKGDNPANGTSMLVVNGGTIAGTSYGISGNGTRHGTSVTINGGEISANVDDGIGIYQPQNGTLVITGDASIEGATAVYVKSGSVSVSGDARLYGRGSASEYSATGNGANSTGQALVIDNCGYPGGAPIATITGGTFFSYENTSDVGSYASGTGNEAIAGFISGGAFMGPVPEEYCAAGYIPAENVSEDEIIYYTVKPGEFVARNTATGQGYETLADAIAAAEAGDTVQMLDDISLTGMLTVPNGKNFTLDLAGFSIVADDANWTVGDSILCVAYGATLTIDDSTGEDLGMIDTYGSEKAFCAIKMTNKGDDPVNGTAALVVNGGAIYGTYYGISGNGTRHGTSVTINGGEISAYADDGIGIYQPQNGSLVITGTGDGGISGATAVYVKSGSVAISGGLLWGTGEAAAYNVSGNGANPTGDALVFDNCGYPGGAPNVSITGGLFRSDSADSLGSYASGVGNEAIAGFVSGGDFTSAVPEEFCSTGYIPKSETTVVGDVTYYTVKQGTYVAQIGANKYETLAAAIDAAQDGETIQLIADITEVGTVKIEKSVTIDGNDKVLTITGGNAANNVFYALHVSDENVGRKLSVSVKNLTLTSVGYQVAIMAGGDYNSEVALEKVNVTCDGECVYANGHVAVTADDCEFLHEGVYATGKDAVYYSALIVGYGGEISATHCSVTSFGNGVATFPSGGTITLTDVDIAISEESVSEQNAGYALFAWNDDYETYPEYCKDSVITFNSGKVKGGFKIVDKYPRGDAKNKYDAVIHVNGGIFSVSPADVNGVVIKTGYEVVPNADEATNAEYPKTVAHVKTGYIVEKDNGEGYAVIPAVDADWIATNVTKDVATATTEKIEEALNTTDEKTNLKKWQAYVLNQTESIKVTQVGTAGALTTTLGNARTDTGLDVSYSLVSVDGASETDGAASGDKSFALTTANDGSLETGLYKVRVHFKPTGDTSASEVTVDSENTVGVLKTTPASSLVVVPVPFKALGGNGEINVSDYIKSGLAIGDTLHVYNGDKYDTWEYTGSSWNKTTNVTKTDENTASTSESAEPSVATLARGTAAILRRSGSTPLVFVGDYTGAAEQQIAEGWNLVASPSLEPFNPATKFKSGTIQIPTGGIPKNYTYSATTGKWGYSGVVHDGNKLKIGRIEVETLPEGTGFWYISDKATTVTW